MLDVIIIGSGAAGLSAAVYAKRAGLHFIVTDRVEYGTGQVSESSQVENYLGFATIDGYELGIRFREHAVKLGIEFQADEAESFQKENNYWRVFLKSGKIIEAKAIIYAVGARHRHLNVKGEDVFLGKGVSYCATCDGSFFKGKSVVVVGGGNTAMDDALYLSEICNKVYLIHRRKEFRGDVAAWKKIQEKSNIEVITEAVTAEIIGENMVSGLLLEDGRQIAAEGIFIAVGMEPQTENIKNIVTLDSKGYVLADETGKTSAAGFFVAGDVRTKALRQIVTAVSDGANAVNSLLEYLYT